RSFMRFIARLLPPRTAGRLDRKRAPPQAKVWGTTHFGRSVEEVVRGQRQELDEVVGERDLAKDLGGRPVGVAEPVDLVVEDRLDLAARDAPVVHPLPDLRPRD